MRSDYAYGKMIQQFMDSQRFKRGEYRTAPSIDGFIRPRVRPAPQQTMPPRPVTFNGTLRQPTQRAVGRPAPLATPPRVPTASPDTAKPTASVFTYSYTGKRHLKNSKNRKFTKKRLVWRSLAIILFIGLGIGGYVSFKGIGALNKVFHGNVFSDMTAAFNNTPLKGENTGRVNILLAGDSVDDPHHAGANLTDSIMVISINTKNHSGFMLSIPRDLWVNVPTLGPQKINAANIVNSFKLAGYPSGGMGQLEEIIHKDLGIPIDYYALIDYTAFRDAVNAVGGIGVNINSPDPRGLYDPGVIPRIPNGHVTLNGATALGLARSRGDQYGSYGFPNSDFSRTMYQREMLLAVAEKAASVGVLGNPVRVTELFDALGNNVHTDLTLQNVLRFIQITKGMNVTNLQSVTYSYGGANGLLTSYTDPSSGEEALIPTAGLGNFGPLQQYYEQLTSSNPIVRESPSVVLLNASDVNGLAAKQRAILQGKGYNVAAIADANSLHPATMIVDNSRGTKPNSLKLLKQLYPGTSVTSAAGSAEAAEAKGYTSDFVVILGQNWDSSNPSPSAT